MEDIERRASTPAAVTKQTKPKKAGKATEEAASAEIPEVAVTKGKKAEKTETPEDEDVELAEKTVEDEAKEKKEEEEEEQEAEGASGTRWSLGVLCFLMLCSSAGLFAVYYLKVQEFEKEIVAIRKIREFMIRHNQSLEGTNDLVILSKAKELADEVVDSNMKSVNLDASVDEIILKLERGWKLLEGSIFYFGQMEKTFDDSLKECEEKKSTLTSVTTPGVQKFLETESRAKAIGLWIGLVRNGSSWRWIDGTTFNETFWIPGHPDSSSTAFKNCVEIKHDCPSKDMGRCWNDIACDNKKIPACEFELDRLWS